MKYRLTQVEVPANPDGMPVDFNRIEQVLGMKKSEFRSLEDTVLSTLEALLNFEKEQAAQGHEINLDSFPRI